MATRIKMQKPLIESTLQETAKVIHIDRPDKVDVAMAMFDSYEGTPDYEDDTVDDFCNEIVYLYDNLYGDFKSDASFCIMKDDIVVAGIFMCIFKDEPTVTYHFTRKQYQNRGLAKELLQATENKLYEMGYKDIYLFLNLDNVAAYNLYDSVGFEETTLSKPKDIKKFKSISEHDNYEVEIDDEMFR